MKDVSAFSVWFKEQFGGRPAFVTIETLQDEVEEARQNLQECEYKLQRLESWELAYTAALYAWQAREKEDM